MVGRWVLASASPRRKEILSLLIKNFDIRVSDVKEEFTSSVPEEIVKELAALKGRAVKADAKENEAVIASDTLVFAEGEILGKPKNRDDARRMIGLLSGRTHRVITGLYVGCGVKEDITAVSSLVRVDVLSPEEIEEYIESEEPYDKAGGYAIQGAFARHIASIEGDYHNIVGFPLNTFYRLAKERGYL